MYSLALVASFGQADTPFDADLDHPFALLDFELDNRFDQKPHIAKLYDDHKPQWRATADVYSFNLRRTLDWDQNNSALDNFKVDPDEAYFESEPITARLRREGLEDDDEIITKTQRILAKREIEEELTARRLHHFTTTGESWVHQPEIFARVKEEYTGLNDSNLAEWEVIRTEVPGEWTRDETSGLFWPPTPRYSLALRSVKPEEEEVEQLVLDPTPSSSTTSAPPSCKRRRASKKKPCRSTFAQEYKDFYRLGRAGYNLRPRKK